MSKRSTALLKIQIFTTTALLSFAMLSFALELVCFSSSWFRHEYLSHCNTSQWIGIDDAVNVTDQMMQYCYGHTDSLDNIKATLFTSEYPDGHEVAFFNHREKHHLADCRNLLVLSHRLAVLCLLLSLASIAFIIIKKKALESARVFRDSFIILTAIAGIAALLFALDSDAAYDMLHELMFDNYLWILNPVTDNLINLMQTDIIIETAMLVLSIWFAVIILASATAHMYFHTANSDRRQSATAQAVE